MGGDETTSAVASLAERAHREFSDVLDYIWKGPRLIESEFKLELEKLDAYFPFTGDPDQDVFAQNLRKGF